MTITLSCTRCGETMLDQEDVDGHDAERCAEWARSSTNMKPLLSIAVHEAVRLALLDVLVNPDGSPNETPLPFDDIALAQNVAIRLLGSGGWTVNGVYTGNASPREILEASIDRPDRDPVAGIRSSLWLAGETILTLDEIEDMLGGPGDG